MNIIGESKETVGIYNPWSVLNYLSESIESSLVLEPKPYWVGTSNNDIIKDLIIKSDAEFKVDLQKLMQIELVLKNIDENIIYTEVSENSSIWSFLFFSDLTKSNKIGDKYELIIPNREILYLYKKVVLEWTKKTLAEY